MTVRYIPASSVTVYHREHWMCEGDLHWHRTREAAEACELRSRVYSRGRTRIRAEDGTMLVEPRYISRWVGSPSP